MEGEINNFINVWVSIVLSTCYCFAVAKIIPKGTTRAVTFLPVVCLFLVLPFILHSIHLGCITIFFVSWISNLKLLLFAFGRGPLSDPSFSLGRFVALTCLPIRIQQNSPPNEGNKEKPLNNPNKGSRTPKIAHCGLKSPIYAIEALLLLFLLFLGHHKDYIDINILLFLSCLYVYIGLDILLALVAALVGTMLDTEMEPHFNHPYFATSLQDFWAHRWNLTVSYLLRLTVYKPIARFFMPILGSKWSHIPAVIGTFFVSGLMHELLIYYVCRVRPTWGNMCYFLFHGLCLIIEVALKKTFTCREQLPQIITGPLTFGFTVSTLIWLIWPQLEKSNVTFRGIEEHEAVVRFLKNLHSSM